MILVPAEVAGSLRSAVVLSRRWKGSLCRSRIRHVHRERMSPSIYHPKKSPDIVIPRAAYQVSKAKLQGRWARDDIYEGFGAVKDLIAHTWSEHSKESAISL